MRHKEHGNTKTRRTLLRGPGPFGPGVLTEIEQFVDAEAGGSDIWVLRRMGYQPRSDGVGKEVADNFTRVVTRTQHALEIAFLPQRVTIPESVGRTGMLFRPFYELSKVRGFAGGFCEDVHVIRHEAVRNKHELFDRCHLKEFR